MEHRSGVCLLLLAIAVILPAYVRAQKTAPPARCCFFTTNRRRQRVYNESDHRMSVRKMNQASSASDLSFRWILR